MDPFPGRKASVDQGLQKSDEEKQHCVCAPVGGGPGLGQGEAVFK